MSKASVSLILLSAGGGRRFGKKKQFEKLLGKEVYLYSLERLLGLFDETILVLPPEDMGLSVPAGVKKVAGAEERQGSVFNALLQARGEVVVIHDCARPFASVSLFEKVADLGGYEGKICALPVRDTLKRVADGFVVQTVDRTGIWQAQTPQAFLRRVLLECHLRAKKDGFFATDDAMLLEHYGYKVAVVMGEPTNIKITYPEDMLLAEAIAKELFGAH